MRYNALHRNSYAFTLVELIVVVTIIAILGTVWFISYSNYLLWARDSSRISQVTRISDALQVHSTASSLPIPDNAVRLENNAILFAYQWTLWENTLQTINYSSSAKDPKDNTPFTYLVTASRNNFQILMHLEEATNLQSFYANVYASLQDRYVKVVGSRLWALVESESLTPIERIGISVYETTNPTTDRYRSYLWDNEFVDWTPTELWELAEVMRDRGRWWVVQNNTFTCMDPEWIFPCSMLAGGWGGGGGGASPWVPWAIPPIITWTAVLASPNITLSSSPSSTDYNNFEVAPEANNTNITLELWDTNNTIVTQFGNDNITAWYGNNHITIWSGNNNIILWDGYNFIQILNGGSNALTFWNGDNTYSSPSGNDIINGWNGNNTLSLWHNDDTIVLWNGDNEIIWQSGIKNITLWSGNNEINISGYGNHTMVFWDGDSIVNLTGWNTQITTGTSGSLDITFGWNQNRTTIWRGWNLIMRDFWRWWQNRINVSQISDLNNCTQVNSATTFAWNTGTVISSQWIMTIYVQDWNSLNCESTFIF